jgi:hypothetical protein
VLFWLLGVPLGLVILLWLLGIVTSARCRALLSYGGLKEPPYFFAPSVP